MKLNLFAVACASVLAFANGALLADSEQSYDEMSQLNADSHLHTHLRAFDGEKAKAAADGEKAKADGDKAKAEASKAEAAKADGEAKAAKAKAEGDAKQAEEKAKGEAK